jgi:hypothetical protein
MIRRFFPEDDLSGTVWPPIFQIAALLAVASIVLVVFKGAFGIFFVQDDFGWLVFSRFHSFADYSKSFFRFNPWGTYRPLSQETYFWAGQMFFGMHPLGFHILSAAAHVSAVLLVYFLLRRFLGTLSALAGAVCYGVHPAHVTSLYWVSAFPESLAMVFILSAVLLFIRYDRAGRQSAYILSLVALLLGIMSKESALTVPLMLAAYCLLFSRAKLLRTFPHFLLSTVFIVIRIASPSVNLSPYKLSFGRQAIRNSLAYFSWMAGLSETLLRSEWGWRGNYGWMAACVAVCLLTLFLLARNKRAAVFALVWVAIGLQPVLYFSDHIFPYYLAPSLAGLSLLIGAALPPLRRHADWMRWLPALCACGVAVGLSQATVKPEGRWWQERTSARHELIRKILAVDAAVPAGGTAYVFGLTAEDYESLENGSIFRAYALQPTKFEFMMPELDSAMASNLRYLKRQGKLGDAFCFRFNGDQLIDQTSAFREDPERFSGPVPEGFLEVAGVTLDVSPRFASRGKDTLVLKASLDVPAIDVLCSRDGLLMPPVMHWLLDDHHTTTVFVDAGTPPGEYEFVAIRASGDSGAKWIKVSAHVTIN